MSMAMSIADLPVAGTMVSASPLFQPALMKGVIINENNPFLFDFIVSPGESKTSKEELKREALRMVRYFFASLTLPDKDIWVNLSPYEKDRIIPTALGQTVMGRDLLAQDYLLKQLTASLMYPENSLGKTFWAKIYKQAQELYGSTQIPVNTFNKVWIVPQKASVYEHGQTGFIVSGHLKVMLEEDYLALAKQEDIKTNNIPPLFLKEGARGSSNIIRQIILPEIEKEVNEGKNFSTLRQIFYAQVLAVWFKRHLKQALLNQVYANKSTVKGIDQNDKATNEAIYNQYLKAYQKGVFNFIKDEFDPKTQVPVAHQYFSGGYDGGMKEFLLRSNAQLASVIPQLDGCLAVKVFANPGMVAEEIQASPQMVKEKERPYERLVLTPLEPEIIQWSEQIHQKKAAIVEEIRRLRRDFQQKEYEIALKISRLTRKRGSILQPILSKYQSAYLALDPSGIFESLEKIRAAQNALQRISAFDQTSLSGLISDLEGIAIAADPDNQENKIRNSRVLTALMEHFNFNQKTKAGVSRDSLGKGQRRVPMVDEVVPLIQLIQETSKQPVYIDEAAYIIMEYLDLLPDDFGSNEKVFERYLGKYQRHRYVPGHWGLARHLREGSFYYQRDYIEERVNAVIAFRKYFNTFEQWVRRPIDPIVRHYWMAYVYSYYYSQYKTGDYLTHFKSGDFVSVSFADVLYNLYKNFGTGLEERIRYQTAHHQIREYERQKALLINVIDLIKSSHSLDFYLDQGDRYHMDEVYGFLLGSSYLRSEAADRQPNPEGGIDLKSEDAVLSVQRDQHNQIHVSVNKALLMKMKRQGVKKIVPIILHIGLLDISSTFGVSVFDYKTN
ncbi:MAG: hypothetical protein HQL13_00945 [Candidatus Omnitrophica bacterium]|nr:hypothetical protein [Candidatus Omnitrophota bacterium]